MSGNLVETYDEVDALPIGQWVIAPDGRVLCLFDTHMGFPQRMWGTKRDGGTRGYVTSFSALPTATLPLHLADPVDDSCTHARTNECGQCTFCGRPDVGERHELHFDAEGLAAFRLAAVANGLAAGGAL